MSPTVARGRIVGLGGSSQSSKSSREPSPVGEKPKMHVKWKLNMLNIYTADSCDIIMFTIIFAQWGISTRYEYQLRMRMASHSVQSPLSRWLLWYPATANDAASRSNETIGPMKIVQCAAAFTLNLILILILNLPTPNQKPNHYPHCNTLSKKEIKKERWKCYWSHFSNNKP